METRESASYRESGTTVTNSYWDSLQSDRYQKAVHIFIMRRGLFEAPGNGMKPWIALLLLFFVPPWNAEASVTVQAGLFASGSTITVKARASGGSLTGSNIPFAAIVTLRYPTTYGVTLSAPVGNYSFVLDTSFTRNGFQYRIYATVTSTSDIFPDTTEVPMFSVSVSGGSGTGGFELVQDSMTRDANANWYFEHNTIDYADTANPFYNKSVANVPLPIQLLTFEARLHGGIVELCWTAQEKDPSTVYRVERSFDRLQWEFRSSVTDGIRLNAVRGYRLIDILDDEGLHFSHVYYRLQSLSPDGKSEFSPVLSLDVNQISNGTTLTHPYPNPVFSGPNGTAQPCFTIQFSLATQQAVTLSLINSLGAEVLRPLAGEPCAPGTFTRTIPTTGLYPGIYWIILRTHERNLVRRLLVR